MIIRLPFFSSIAPDGHSDKTDTQAEEEGFRHESKGAAQSQADEQTDYQQQTADPFALFFVLRIFSTRGFLLLIQPKWRKLAIE